MENKQQIMSLLKARLRDADTVLIGAGAGLSTAAGFTYSGQRFDRYFGDFGKKYRFTDMYSGGFYPYKTQEEFWAYWSRHIYVNRYMDPPFPVYQQLLELVRDKDYFVLTTNVDHCFQKAGFDKKRLFYTQGDYGLLQCSVPCHHKTYDNADIIRRMVLSQGFEIGAKGELIPPEGVSPAMAVPKDLLPRCPVCGKPMTMNLRSDDKFVEDAGWHAAAARYSDFAEAHEKGPILYLELGVGMNTPTIVKIPFLRAAMANPQASYACLSLRDIYIPAEIADRSFPVEGDIRDTLSALAQP